MRRLTREGNGPDVLVDASGEAFDRLGVSAAADGAQYLVRPDGYIAFRCAGRDLEAVASYLASWQASGVPNRESLRLKSRCVGADTAFSDGGRHSGDSSSARSRAR